MRLHHPSPRKQGGSAMTIRPDPTFHASPKLAMEAPPESFAYTLLLSPDFSKPDALAVIDVKPGSPRRPNERNDTGENPHRNGLSRVGAGICGFVGLAVRVITSVLDANGMTTLIRSFVTGSKIIFTSFATTASATFSRMTNPT